MINTILSKFTQVVLVIFSFYLVINFNSAVFAAESNTCENPNNPNNQCSGDRCTSDGRQVCSCVPYGGGWAYRYGSPESAWCNSDTNRGWCEGSSSKNANCGTGETCSGGTCSGTGGGGGGGTTTVCTDPPGNTGDSFCFGESKIRCEWLGEVQAYRWKAHPYVIWCDASGDLKECFSSNSRVKKSCEFGCGSPSAGAHACCTNAERDAGTCGTPKGGSGGGGGGGGGSTPTDTPVPQLPVIPLGEFANKFMNMIVTRNPGQLPDYNGDGAKDLRDFYALWTRLRQLPDPG